jgi:hypothetical protein
VQGRKPVADSGSKAFFGTGNILDPKVKLGEERDLFVFITARILKPAGSPAGK